MRKLILLLPLLFTFACADRTPIEPEMALSPDLGLTEAAAKNARVVKMVPFRMSGEWWYGDTGPVTDCGELGSSVYPTWEGQATHMGRVTGMATNCMDGVGTGGPYFLHLQSSAITAANGDILYAHGTAVDDGIQIVADLDAGTFEVFPVPFVGGTGRFSNATGYYHLTGTLGGGPFWATGWISSVGSSK